MHFSFYHVHVVLVKFYCYVIAKSRLQLNNTLINTFFSELCAFLAEQRRKREASGGYKKLNGAVDESLVDH